MTVAGLVGAVVGRLGEGSIIIILITLLILCKVVIDIALALGIERPGVALMEVSGIGVDEGAGLDLVDGGGPGRFVVNAVPVVLCTYQIVTCTNLATCDLYQRAVHDLSVLRAAIDGGDDETAADEQVRGVRYGQFVGDGIAAVQTLAGAEDIAVVVVGGRIIGVGHVLLVQTHQTAADDDLGLTRACLAGLGLALDVQVALAGSVIGLEGTHGAELATAVDTAMHMAILHLYLGVLAHQSVVDIGLRTLTATIDGAFNY